MTQYILVPPPVEPLTLEDVKAHIRVENGDEEPLIRALLTAARTVIEVDIRHALIRQSRRFLFDRSPRIRRFEIPLRPLISIDAVRLIDQAGESVQLDRDKYRIDPLAPSITIRSGSGSASFVEVDVTAGFGPGPADVPSPIKQAIVMLTTHWYENRSSVLIGEAVGRLPESVQHCLAPYRRLALC